MTAGLLGSDVYDRLGAYISKLLEKFFCKLIVDRHINNSIKICVIIFSTTFTIGVNCNGI